MYHSLKKQQRIRLPWRRRTMKCDPLESGRNETSMATSDEGDLIALSNAKRRGEPMYFIRTSQGVILDVLLEKAQALRVCLAIRDRMRNTGPRIDVYERKHTALVCIS